MIAAWAWLLTFQLTGEAVVRSLKLPLPGAMIGMALLFAACAWRPGLADQVRVVGTALTQHLMLLVVPATTGLITQLDRLWAEWMPIMLAVVVSAALTMAATALTLRLSLAFQRKDARSC